MGDSEKNQAAVYVSWATFKTAIGGLAEGVPNVVDRSAFPGMSWGVQAQLLAGLKFLGLTDDDGKPTTALHGLAVPDEAVRKEKLKAILKDRYPDLFALNLEKTTPAQLAETLAASYGVGGDTKEKAMRFFLSALTYVGIPVSRFLVVTKGGGTSSPRRRRSVPRKPTEESDAPYEEDGASENGRGTSRTITLTSGGTVTVTVAVDVLALNALDRAFVFVLKDKLDEYEGSKPPAGAKS